MNRIILTKKRFMYLQAVILLLLLLFPVYAAGRQLNSIDLIEKSYRNGQIRHSEAVNYKVNAIFRPESLPARYRSKGIIKSATPVLMEARLNRHLLSRENSRILARGRVNTLTDLYATNEAVLESYISPEGLVWTDTNNVVHTVPLRSYASPESRFRIHFTVDNTDGDAVPADDANANGVPDYVERFADILDNVWTNEIEVMGYDAPPSDGTEGGDCLLDVYLADLNAYGYTQIDDEDPVSMVYMIFENDFSLYFPPNTDPEGDTAGAMKVVAAHEFFHTIQFQVTEDICTNGWWMEASATWMEDYIFPDVNDYINYIDYWFQHPNLPLNTYPGCTGISEQTLFPYGTTIWIKHMTEKYGSEFVFDVWNEIKAGTTPVTALSAVIEALTDRGTTLEEELKELRVANITMTYEDAPWYQLWQTVNPDPNPVEVVYSGTNPDFSSSVTYTAVSISELASKYYSFSAPLGNGNLSIDFNGSGSLGVMVAGFNADETAYDITEIVTDTNDDGSLIINGFGASGPYSRVVVIPFNYSYTSASQESFDLTVSYTTAYYGNLFTVDIKPDATSLVTGDNGINGKQQYHLIMRDDSNKQVLKTGTSWGDDSSNISINGNGLGVLTGTVTGGDISASILSLPPGHATLSAVSPAIMSAGTPRVCAVISTSTKSDSRCFIATAAFGSPLHPYVSLLREFRDSYLLTNPLGRWLVSIYYNNSPPIAEIVKTNQLLKAIVKIFLIPAIIVSWVMLKITLAEKIIAGIFLLRLLQKSPFCHSRRDSERESGSKCLKNHIPDRGIRG